MALWGTPGRPKAAGMVLRDTPRALPRCFFGFSRRLGSPFGGLLGDFRVFRFSWELQRGVEEMVRHGFTVRLCICGWNLRARISIADGMTCFSGSAAVGAAQ